MATLIKQDILSQRLDQIEPLVGNTPLRRIENIASNPAVEIYAKLEWLQIGGSVKARPAFNIIKEAIRNDELHLGKTLLDASSGNTAIAYAAIGAKLGIQVEICLPENASKQRVQILGELGAKIHFTSKFESTDGAQEEAQRLYDTNSEKYFYADQYSNPNNWKAHYQFTAVEILRQTNNRITHFVAGLGTTGTFIGTGSKLKEVRGEEVKLTALQPETIMHGLEGWKDLESAKVPAFYNPNLADEVLYVPTQEAYDLVDVAWEREGLRLSPSSAANLYGAIQVADKIEKGVIVTVFPDNADKYSDTPTIKIELNHERNYS